MGICISTASTEIHDQPEISKVHEDNAIFVEQNDVSNEVKKPGSLYSKQGSKGPNQDAAILCQGYGVKYGAFCGVFDGHGKNGQIVSRIVRDQLPSLVLDQKSALAKMEVTNNRSQKIGIERLDGEEAPSNEFYKWQEACVGAFKVMDKEVKLQENLDCSCSGTTAVVVIRQGEDLVTANLGDSRAVLGTVSEKGEVKAVQLTTDLKPGLPSEAERIRKCNGRVLALKEEPHIPRVWLPHEDFPGLAMSRAFGDFLLKNHGVISVPDVCYHRLTSRDQFVVLATDGVFDVLSSSQVASIVSEAGNEQEATRAVVEAATVAWKNKFPSSKVDDCTAVCLYLQNRQQRQLS
ncbi:probable protein phosphatase 2C 72 isoform X2 [Mangifera indica]|uniref:probable protein phosphatase 2C 72 isoform X2 n=1 Tax=Mangifera indica TaxID=29780 RepID=UPI001CFB833D|nr:probable protein phosphatase 2C 72 isoform X2 [Mangifera indica]